MTNLKQLDRLVLKIVRLKDAYSEYVVSSLTEQDVYLNGKKIEKGQVWGEEFGCGKFTFAYQPEKYVYPYLYVENGGVEHLLSADGKPFGMADYLPDGKDAIFRCHKYVSLSGIKKPAEITVDSYASHTFFGTMPFEKKQTFSINGYRPARVYNGIYVAEIDETVKRFVDDLSLLTSYFRIMPDGDKRKIEAYKTYEKLFDLLTVLPERSPDRNELAKASGIIGEFLSSLKNTGADDGVYVGLVGHSHLDTAWLWTVDEARRKALRTAANAVTLLKKYPQYRFIMSSALYMSWIEQDSPELFGEIRALVKEGRFEPNGATWVECDCNLTDGESMIRQFVRGKRYLKEKFGYDADVFWLPDTFGYSAALPQILRGCGVPYFLTTKLSWNDTNRFPYDSFIWRGIDGSEVTVHFNTIQTTGDPEAISSRVQKRLNKHLTEHVLMAYGYGDGGGGPSADMVENALRTAETYPYAKAEHTSVSAFMKKLETEELPRYAGELYLELHRGTLTTNHDMKKLNRTLENALKDAELICAGTGDFAGKDETDRCYDVLLLNQFHDILPGTCIKEVYDTAKEQERSAIAALENRFFRGERLLNTLSSARREVILNDCSGEQSFKDFDGNEKYAELYDFEPFSFGKKVVAPKKRSFFFDEETGRAETPYCTAIVKNGAIQSLSVNGREIAAAPLNDICVYEDVPYLWDNWDVDADYERKKCVTTAGKTVLVSVGKLFLRLRTEFTLAGKSKLTQDIVFYAHTPVISFESKLEWNDDHKFVKALFPTNVASDELRSEIQFGYINRPATRNTCEEQAKYEVCNHKWSDLSEPRFGVSFLNDCKYGISADGGTVGISLLKSGKRPDVAGESGIKYFNYAILPHEGGFCAETVILPAYAFNRCPVPCTAEFISPVKFADRKNIIAETVKISENRNGIAVRLYECERTRTDCNLYLNGNYEIYECDMTEENKRLIATGDVACLSFRQFEIKTLFLKKI